MDMRAAKLRKLEHLLKAARGGIAKDMKMMHMQSVPDGGTDLPPPPEDDGEDGRGVKTDPPDPGALEVPPSGIEMLIHLLESEDEGEAEEVPAVEAEDEVDPALLMQILEA